MRAYKHRHALYLLWLVALVAYHMPWTAHPIAAFTLNGFDLAEQVRYHPAVMAEMPPLRSSMFIWLAMPVLATGLALTAQLYRSPQVRLWLTGLAGLVALRVNPPESALRRPRLLVEDDYAFALMTLTVLGISLVVLAAIFGPLVWRRFGQGVLLGLCALGIILPGVGAMRALQIMRDLGVDVNLGAGLIVYSLVLLTIGGLAWRSQLQSTGDSAKDAEAAASL